MVVPVQNVRQKRGGCTWGLQRKAEEGVALGAEEKNREPPTLIWLIRQSRFTETKRGPRAALRMPLVQVTGSPM